MKSDNIFKIFVHFHNQDTRNTLCTNFAIILCNFNFRSFVPLFCALWTTSVTIFSKSSPIFIISVPEMGFAPTNLEIILCNFNFRSFVPLFVPFGRL